MLPVRRASSTSGKHNVTVVPASKLHWTDFSYLYSSFFAEFNCPGSSCSERRESEAVPGAAAGSDNQRRGAAGRLLVHAGLAPRAHHRRVHRHPPGPAGPAGRVPPQREYRRASVPQGLARGCCLTASGEGRAGLNREPA